MPFRVIVGAWFECRFSALALFLAADPRLDLILMHKQKEDMVGDLPVNQMQHPLVQTGVVQANLENLDLGDGLASG